MQSADAWNFSLRIPFWTSISVLPASAHHLFCGVLATANGAVDRAVSAFRVGSLAGEEERPRYGPRQSFSDVRSAHQRIAVSAASERIASPVVREARDEMSVDRASARANRLGERRDRRIPNGGAARFERNRDWPTRPADH